MLQSKGVPLSPVRLALLSCRRGASPKCTGGQYQNASANSTAYLRGFPNVNQRDNGIAKIDYHIKARHTVSGVLLVGNYTGAGEDHAFVNQGFLDTSPIRTWFECRQLDLAPLVRYPAALARLSFIAGYTYVHGLDNGSLNRFGLIPQDGTTTEYASSDFDIRFT